MIDLEKGSGVSDIQQENARLIGKLYEALIDIARLERALKMAVSNYTKSCDGCPLIEDCGYVSSSCEDAVYKYFYDRAGE